MGTIFLVNIYISREISIEHPSVGLASLAQLRTEKHREVGRGVSVLRRCGSVMEGVMALPRRRHGCKIRWAEIVKKRREFLWYRLTCYCMELLWLASFG